MVISLSSRPLCLVTPAIEERRRRSGLCQLWWRMNWGTAARLSWSCRVRWSGWVHSTVQHTLPVSTPSQSHVQPVTPAYTSGQPSTSSEPVPVANVSSAVIGLSVTVAMVIVISVIIVIIGLAVIIVLCQHQGMMTMIYCTCAISYASAALCHVPLQLCIE